MTAEPSADVRLVCSRCARRLVSVRGAWALGRDLGTRAFLCPAFSACGFGGLREDAREVVRYRARAGVHAVAS